MRTYGLQFQKGIWKEEEEEEGEREEEEERKGANKIIDKYIYTIHGCL